MRRKTIFIRDDDVYRIDGSFMALFDFCLQHKIPVAYGVIPKKATPDLAKLLNKTKENHPLLIDIIQHGWQHRNYNTDLTDKYEFGGRRNYLQQKKDIQKGLDKMTGLFGRNFTYAFCPPYHGYSLTTLKIINELKFAIFSADKLNPDRKSTFLDLPACVSLNEYTASGEPMNTNTPNLIKKIIRCLDYGDGRPLGIILHHRTLKSRKARQNLFRFFLFLNRLRRKKVVKLVSLSELLLTGQEENDRPNTNCGLRD